MAHLLVAPTPILGTSEDQIAALSRKSNGIVYPGPERFELVNEFLVGPLHASPGVEVPVFHLNGDPPSIARKLGSSEVMDPGHDVVLNFPPNRGGATQVGPQWQE